MGNADEAAPDQGPEQAAQEVFHLGRRGVVTGAAAIAASVAADGVAAQGGIVLEQGGPTVPTRLAVNGTDRTLELDPRSSLLDVLRERLALTGAKKGCDHGQCGACTVHLNGRRVASCLTMAVQADGRRVTTIEGLARPGRRCIPCSRPSSTTMPCSAVIARRGRSWRRWPASRKATRPLRSRSAST